MKSARIPLLLFLLVTPGLCQESVVYNISYVENVVERVLRTHNWTTTLIFRGELMTPQELNQMINFLQGKANAACYIFKQTKPELNLERMLRDYIKDDTLSLLFVYNQMDDIWKLIDQCLRQLHQTKLLVVLPEQRSATHRRLQKIFDKLWQLQFLNVIVLHRNQIYRYTPYPTVSYASVVDTSVELFPAPERNFRGYVVSTPAENDIPRVFYVKDTITGRNLIRGFGYQIFVEFLRRHNATLHITNSGETHSIYSSVNMSNINEMIGAQKLEVSLHPYVGINKRLGKLSYPLLKAPNCLIVPVQNEIPRYMYLLRPFQSSCYLLLLIASLYISCILYWLSPSSSRCNARKRFERVTRSFLQSMSHLLLFSSMAPIQQPSLRYFCVALQLAILGFFVTNWYLNLLSSFFTTFLVGEQVNTLEQLIAVQLPIMLKYYERDMLLEQVPPQLRRQINDLILGVNASVQVTSFLNFSRDYSFPFTIERWKFFARQQQYANKPIYRYSPICFGEPVIGYPMRNDSHLAELLKQFIMDVQMAGLFDEWLVYDFKDALTAGYVRFINNELPFKALDLDTLRLAWYIDFVGWSLATLAFVLERWWYLKFEVSQLRKRNNILHDLH